MHEGREGSIEREMEVARPIEGVWETRRKRCGTRWRRGGAGGGPREVKSPEDGPRPVSRGIVGGDTGE